MISQQLYLKEQQRSFDEIFKHFNQQYYSVPIAYQMKPLSLVIK